MNSKLLSILIITNFINLSFGYDKFFGNITRATLFEKTDFVVSDLKVSLTEDDYKNFFLSHQCTYDTYFRNKIRNDECYTAPWVDLDYALNKTFTKNYIDKSLISKDDMEIINKKNITIDDFSRIVENYSNYTLEEIMSSSYNLYSIPSFETDNAGMDFDINGDVTNIPGIKISVGGKYSRAFQKLAYNIKIKKNTLFDRKQLRLRPDVVDPSFMREKLAYDICNVLEMPSLSANYINLYFNKRFMGLYTLRDAFKSQWIEETFGEKKTKNLYTCNKMYGTSEYFNCINDDEDITVDKDWENFIKRLESTTTREQLEEFFDVKTFIKWQAIKYLLGSWDHKTNAHNLCMYMYHDTSKNNDLWIPLLYDFDNILGAHRGEPNNVFSNEIYESSNPIFKILNLDDDNNQELIQEISNIMEKVYNPETLIPRIDELKKFISPYIKADRTKDENGNFPGRVIRTSNKVEDGFTYEDFLANTEFSTIELTKYATNTAYSVEEIISLKQWIIERYKFACEFYKIDCSRSDEFLKGIKYEESVIKYTEKHDGCLGSGYDCCKNADTAVVSTDGAGRWGIENNEWCIFDDSKLIPDSECWSLEQGYPCCINRNTKIAYTSKSSGLQWGVENNEWCGITGLQLCPNFSSKYKCCSKCNVVYTDTEKWGYENGQWCSIPYSCSETATTASNAQ